MVDLMLTEVPNVGNTPGKNVLVEQIHVVVVRGAGSRLRLLETRLLSTSEAVFGCCERKGGSLRDFW